MKWDLAIAAAAIVGAIVLVTSAALAVYETDYSNCDMEIIGTIPAPQIAKG